MASFSFPRLFALVLLVLVASSLGAKPLGREVCPASCYYALLNAKFAAADEKSQAACTNPLRVKSTFYCIALHCNGEDVGPGINWWATTCKSKKTVNLDAYNTAVSKVNDSYLDGLPTVDYKSKKGKVVNGTVLPSDANWLIVHRSVKTYSDMREYADKIRWVQYGFWALVLVAGMVARAWSLLRPQSLTSKPSTANKIVSWFRFNVQLSPTFKRHHFEPYGLISIPLRLQSITIFAYIVTQIALCAAHYPIYDESSYYSNRQAQSLRYLSDRLGTLMSSSLPFVFLFAARSNPFVYLTGWGYKVFSVFHRWIAIVLVVEGIIHGVCFSAHYVNDKGWATYRDKLAHEEKFLYGLLMVISTSLSSFLVIAGIRKRFYELFKTTHIALAAIFLAAFYEHIKEQFKGVYRVWCWVCVGIWAADYVVRIIRIIVVNFRMFLGKDSPAIASYSPDTGMIRLQVHLSSVGKKQTPGKYYFLYFGGMRFFEAHPFSLAGTTTRVAQQLQPRDLSHEKSATAMAVIDRPVDSPFLTFMIRPQSGLTKSVRDAITKKAVSGQIRMRVVLEGPYGTPANLDGFNNILFIVGGSGITAVIPYIRRIFEDGADGAAKPNVKLIWTARHKGLVRDVFANDLSQSEACSSFSQEFYITSESTEPGTVSDSGSADEGSGDDFNDRRFSFQRLQVSTAIDKYLSGSQGSTAVFVCAPARMADEARVALIKHEKANPDGRVRLFEEMYGW